LLWGKDECGVERALNIKCAVGRVKEGVREGDGNRGKGGEEWMREQGGVGGRWR